MLPVDTISEDKYAPAPASASLKSPKTVVFIRHAESHWNRAAKPKRPHLFLLALLGRDHTLTSKGYAQAAALQEALRECKAHGAGNGLAAAHDAGTVWISPLTRALQTALVGLLPVLTREPAPPPVRLRPLIKEQRSSIASRDNVGAGTGENIFRRACARLARLPAPPVEASLSAMRDVGARSDLAEVQQPWWYPRRENRRALHVRTSALIDELRADEHATVVVVSHSNFLKILMEQQLADDGCPERPGLARALQTTKLPNCGVLVCTLESEGARPLRNARVVWPPDGADTLLAKAAHGRKPKGGSGRVAAE